MAGTVARPKVYIDYISYFRATGLIVADQSLNVVEDASDLFYYNPSNTKEFNPINSENQMQFNVQLGDGQGEASKLVKSINFGAWLNHNVQDINSEYITINSLDTSNSTASLSATVLNNTDGKNNFRLLALDDSLHPTNSYGISFKIDPVIFTTPVKLGSLIAGRSFTFPHNANLSMNINNETNITKTRTLGGSDIVDINYYRQPLWNGYPPFVATNEPSISATSSIGRRSWALTFSFLTQDSTFPQDMAEGFMFDNNITDDTNTWTNWTTENITSHFMTLTLNGQLPFMFQPDDTKDVFAWCRLKSNTFSVQQSAPNLYTSKMTFEEVW